MGGRNPSNRGKGEAIKWLHVAYARAGETCLVWPFNKPNGYGMLGHLGKMHYAHVLMCEWRHGQRPSPGHEASHSCGNGHKGCVNPLHLSWKTRTENQLDRAAHGTKARRKLTPEKAAQIRAMRGQKTQAELARMFGVSRANVSLIQNGDGWHGPRGTGWRRKSNNARF